MGKNDANPMTQLTTINPKRSLTDAFEFIDSYRAEHDAAAATQAVEQLVCPHCKSLLRVTYRGTLVCNATGIGCFSFAEYVSENGVLVEVLRD